MGHIFLMNTILKSERLLLRPLIDADKDIEIEMSADPDVMKFIGELKSAEQVIGDMHKYIRRCAGGCIGIWCVMDLLTHEKYGTAVLLPLPIDVAEREWNSIAGEEVPDGDIEVGYKFKKSAWGRGYATETCCRLLKLAFEETPLQEIVAITHPDHTVSQSVLRKSGLIDEGLRQAYTEQCAGFRITRKQWQERNGRIS